MTLSNMMDIISKWNPKETKTSNAVANYSALPGNLKKVHAKKQSSGRGSGKDNIGRAVVETRACLACKKVGHLVKDCRNKEAKEAWLAKREKRQSRREDDDEPRGRKHEEAHVRETGARSATQAEAPRANGVTGASARTIATFLKRRNSLNLLRIGCPAMART